MKSRRRAAAAAQAAVALMGILLVVPCVVADDDDGHGKDKKARKEALAAAALKINKLCFDCHIDFKDEDLSQDHQEQGVSCARCHGMSKPHMDDEVRKTPPDVVFRKGAMTVFCLTCHKPGEYREVPMHKAQESKPPQLKRRTCTGCHGDHKLVSLEPQKPN